MLQKNALLPLDETFAELSEELGRIPHLSEKMLIDIVNGNNTYKDLLNSKKKQGVFSRFTGFLDGSSRRREIMMQEHVSASLESMTSWMLDLTDTARFTMDNLGIIADRLKDTREDLMKVANALVLEHEAVKRIEFRLVELENRISAKMNEFDRRIRKLEVENEIGKMISAWENNRLYGGYPLTAQVFFLIDDLVRGERREIIWDNRDTREYLYDSVVNVYHRKSGGAAGQASLKRKWLPSVTADTEEMQSEVISYALCRQESAKLHNIFAEYSLVHELPENLNLWQEQGMLPELMDINDLVVEIGRESCKTIS